MAADAVQRGAVRTGLAPADRRTLTDAPLPVRRETARKAIHLAALAFPLAYATGVPQPVVAATAAAALTVAALVELARRRSARVAHGFHGMVGGLLRPHEVTGVTGATWLALAVTLAVVVFPRPAALAALWCAVAGDAAAGLVGRALAPAGAGKSLAGSLACLIVSAAGVTVLGGAPVPTALLVGGVATVAERWGPGDDNMRVALATGLLASALHARAPWGP